MAQVRHNVRERFPKLEWQTLDLENIQKKQNKMYKNDQITKKNNEGCLPQTLSLKSSARLSTRDDYHSE
jgi:hypothetical protein